MNDIDSLKILIIVILTLILFNLIYIIISNKQYENFESLNENITHNIKNTIHDKNNSVITGSQKNILKTEIENLKQKLTRQNQEIAVNKYYTKYNGHVSDLIAKNTTVPKMSFKDKIVINTKADLNNVINEINQFKNNYNVGDIVTKSSDFNITADDICYKNNKKLKNETPHCMVCSTQKNINEDNNTNIKSVCLYGKNGPVDFNKCQNLCSVSK